MERWVTVPVVGTGTSSDPRRPALGPAAVRGYAVAADSGTEMLVLVNADPVQLALIVGTVHADEALTDAARAAVVAEAARLGNPGCRPEGYGTHPEGG